MKIKVLQQDECAPDSLENFIKGVKEKTGVSFGDFIHKGTEEHGEYSIRHVYKDFSLEYSCDFPYWVLYHKSYTRGTCPQADTWFTNGGRCGWGHPCAYCKENTRDE